MGLNFRAEDRARTGHPDLGKVVLYQMSYFRKYAKKELDDFWECKNSILSLPAKFQPINFYL